MQLRFALLAPVLFVSAIAVTATLSAQDKPADKPADPSEKISYDADPHVDRQLDKGLKETFPASDPVSINPGAD